MKTRRDFLKTLGLTGAVFISGEAFSLENFKKTRKKVKLRFIVASDGHYGQANTDYDANHENLVTQINAFARSQKTDFVVINGDLIHDEPTMLPKVKSKLDKLETPYYVSRGNHDRVSDKAWEALWQMPLNLSFNKNDYAVIIGDTSNEQGEFLKPDINFLKTELDRAKNAKSTFVFLHIPQVPWVEYCLDNKDVIALFAEHKKQIKAVFHGHIHSLDDLKMHEGIPYLFDAHIGGNWGTAYKGFRVVEVMKDGSVLTYMMNPTEKIKLETFA
jgi:DNA repair exonuclease SbcCD nuclease subunit